MLQEKVAKVFLEPNPVRGERPVGPVLDLGAINRFTGRMDKLPNRSVLSYPFTGDERMLFVVKPCDFEDSMLVHFFTFCSTTCLDGWVSEEKDGKLGGITWFAGPCFLS